MKSKILMGALASVLACACSNSQIPGNQSPTDFSAAPADGETTAKWEGGRLVIDVPVQVVVIGLADEVVEDLQGALDPYTIDAEVGDFNQVLYPDLDEIPEQGAGAVQPLGGEAWPQPVLPTAHYQVTAAPAALVDEFREKLAAVQLDNNRLDANAMEDWLAEALPRHGFALDPGAPSLVLLHLSAFGIQGHGWKFVGPTGWLEPVRLFGERHPLIVIDPSAIADPYAGTSQVYSSPQAEQAHAAMAAMIRELTEYRVLQGSIYPIAQAPCHAVTGILGIKATSLGAAGVLRSVEDALHPEWIKQSFDHLTGTDVFFDLKVLSLPVDDPALDAFSRGEFPAMYALQAFLTVQWEQYHVDHPGCEEYLSVVFANDAAGVPGGGILGIGTYDDNPGKRVSMSWVHDVFRFLLDPESPGCAVGSQVFSEHYCINKEYMNWWDYLLSHETGHILGQRHTHDVSRNGGGVGSNNAFSAVWSSMSYQQDGRMIDFGAIDHNNWLRNRAGFALELAAAAGREGSPEWTAAMAAANAYDWQGVWEALQAPAAP